MKLRAQLDAAATLLDEGAATSAVRMLRSSWEPELAVDDLVPLYCMWIRALCDSEDIEHARTLAERASDEFPREPDILIALGNVYDLEGELESARDAFSRAIEADASGALQHYNLGAVLERLGDEDGAEASYREALAIETDGPTLFEASAALGALLRRSGRLEEAAGVYESYLDEDPINVDVLVEHGICLSDLDCFEEAIERFELALSLDRNHAGAWYNLAITEYRMGRSDRALRAMQRACEADPQSPLTLAVLGAWLLARHDQNAEKSGSSAEASEGDAEPEEAPAKADATDQPGGIGDLDKALSLLYGALDLLRSLDSDGLSPSYASLVCEEVFEALWQHGRYGEAREVARMAGQRDWISAHMLNTMNEADHGRAAAVSAYTVTARAEAPDEDAPEYWPRDAHGFTTGLTVLAENEDEAREYSLEYLRRIESPSVRLRIDSVRPGGLGLEHVDTGNEPRARGVVGVLGSRSYFR